MHCVNVDVSSAGALQAWPDGLDAFRNVHFLQLVCQELCPSNRNDILDLVQYAYISLMHVSICS